MSRTCTPLRVAILAVAVLSSMPAGALADVQERRPNILLLVADDLGYSDLGAYGGEIRTPHIDGLASRGILATDFYTSPTCSPTRAMLLTGTDNHIAGLGNMAEWLDAKQKGKPGYEGHLNDRVVTLPTLLGEAGYHTYMAGKWHLGEEPAFWPTARGFERDLSLLGGAGSHWRDMRALSPNHPTLSMTRNGNKIEELPEGYFSSKNMTDFLIQNIESNRHDGRPFLAYLAFQAPHGPLAVPDAWRGKYEGRYGRGYDALRGERLARQRRLGLVAEDATAYPRLPDIPAWEELTVEERQRSARKMELYAAMVEHLDDQVGRLLGYLEASGELDDTVIFFLSDNGAAGEDIAELVAALDPRARRWFADTFDNRFENWGRPGSSVDYGPAWAQVSMVPFRQFKGVVAEGGIRAPLIVAGPGVEHNATIVRLPLHVMDIVPTVLDLTGVRHISEESGEEVAPIQGRSMQPLLAGREDSVRADEDWLGWELFGNRAIRQGDWKLLRLLDRAGGSGDWQLFNLREDPAELHDLSESQPARRLAMTELWDEYASSNGVVVGEAGPFAKPPHKGVQSP